MSQIAGFLEKCLQIDPFSILVESDKTGLLAGFPSWGGRFRGKLKPS
jgi:hypothetical protein